ncbi:MAG: DUF4258 domain-containing protein [Nanoarchaeota archaeon]|nr:DUF4258 domain-containing protein [Nanoarchaeota archaeon]MBU2458778.1 DUF4258 domain-containing protein [Nanoarchaeota archaeon]
MSDGVYMELLISKHALEQARERGISVNEIKETIQNGSKFIRDEKEKKIVSDYRHIRIVFKKLKERYYILTVMIRK